MPIVNYVREHVRFIEYAADEQLTGSERLLWYALMHIFNQRAQGGVWPEGFIRIANDRVLTYTGMKFDAMSAARNRLKQRGLIDFISGKGSEKGGAKAVSPLYRMIYFSQEQADHSENTDGHGDGLGYGLGDGSRDGLGDGMGDIDININEESKHIPNQTDEEEDNPTTGGDARARARFRLYARRREPLNATDANTYNRLRIWLDASENVRRMYGAGMELIYEMLESDCYPMVLMGYAIEKTVERDARFERPLNNPVGYTQRLLDDWKAKGFKTIADVQEAKDDWGHYA